MHGVADADLEPTAVMERFEGEEQPENITNPAAAMAMRVGLFRLIVGIEFDLAIFWMDRNARAKVTDDNNSIW